MNAPLEKLAILGELTIRAISSDEDPYGTGGFSAMTVHILPSDLASAEALKKRFASKTPVTVRCGGLEVDGHVDRYDEKLPGVARMSVTGIRLIRPH